MMICYSHFLDLKSLFERVGLFPTLRMNQDLNILSNGQILTMNDVQKEFIQTMAQEDHVEKDVIVTGPVGLGKTHLGLEAINIKTRLKNFSALKRELYALLVLSFTVTPSTTSKLCLSRRISFSC